MIFKTLRAWSTVKVHLILVDSQLVTIRTYLIFGAKHRTNAICRVLLALLQAQIQYHRPEIGAVHDQVDFSTCYKLLSKPLNSNWLIPFTSPNGWIVEKTLETLHCTLQFCFPRNFPSDPTQVNRAALVNPAHQQNKIPNSSDPLSWTQFANLLNPGMIQLALFQKGKF